MPGAQNQQVLSSGTLSWRCVCPCDIAAHATTYSRQGAPIGALDSTFSNGAYWDQPRLASNTTTAQIPTVSPGSSSIPSQGCKLNLPQCHECQPSAHGTQEFSQDETQKRSTTCSPAASTISKGRSPAIYANDGSSHTKCELLDLD